MLPRLKPRALRLVIEVAIVRPGPIQGAWCILPAPPAGAGAVDYPSEELRPVFERTLGIAAVPGNR